MSTPEWVLGIFAAVMLVVAEVSAGQLVLARGWTRRDIPEAVIAASRLLTGIALAGILVSGLMFLPNAAWATVFAIMTAWFAWCLWRESQGRGVAAAARGRYAPHLVQNATTLYLYAALAGLPSAGSGTSLSGTSGMPGMPGMSGMSGGSSVLHVPTLALVFALLLVAYTVHDLDRQANADGYFHAAGSPPVLAGSALAAAATRLLLSPAVVKACQVATGVTLAFLLVIMI